MVAFAPDNEELARVLDRLADLLHARKENPFRVRAYRHAAATVAGYHKPVASLIHDGDTRELEALPEIGKGIASSVAEYVRTSRLRLLERLERETSAVDVFTTVPGIGPELAGRLHEHLGVRTLEELEVAAHEGRLGGVPGVGRRRAEAIRDSVEALLDREGRRRGRRARRIEMHHENQDTAEPPVELLLRLDERYRRNAEAGHLRRIAPRRFNPEGEAWLPIMHDQERGWHVTLMYSNTARAHERGATHDWVVVYYENGGPQRQSTVVTEHQGRLKGLRVIRGREQECADYYAATQGKGVSAGDTPGHDRARAGSGEPAPAPGKGR